MILKTIVVGSYEVNCFITGCSDDKNVVVIDPGDDAKRVIKYLEDEKLNIKYIINTHAHADHIGGIIDIKSAFPDAIYLLHEKGMLVLDSQSTKDMLTYLGLKDPPKPDKLIKEETPIKLCDHLEIKVLHIPGHSPGGIALLIQDSLFTGDSLFAGSIGRTDFPLSSHHDLITSIKSKLLTLGDDIKIYPGHGPESTIGNEKQNNPFLL